MASISSRSNGSKIIEYVDGDGRRRTIFLAKMSQRDAVTIKAHIERLLAAKLAGLPLDQQTALWLAKIGDKLRQKLATVGLIEATATSAPLGEFLAGYIAKRTDIKLSTRQNIQQSIDNLICYFGADKRLHEVTEGDAKDFRLFLAREGGITGKPLLKNTVNDRCRRARQMFASAVEHRLIDRNPFAVLKGIAVKANPDRFVYVSAADTLKVIEVAGDADFQLVIALCRFAGLRNPSETLNLRWENVDLPAGRMTVDSPKTEHHEGKAYRVVPIFPEVRPFLEQAWKRAGERAEYVVEAWRSQSKNMRTRMRRAIRRAGLKPWTKTFQNLRSSCQTDLEERFPSHVVCAWLGNSERVAREHYLQVTDEHFTKASGEGSMGESMGHLLARAVMECYEQTGGSLGDAQNQPKPLRRTPRPKKMCPRKDSNLEPTD